MTRYHPVLFWLSLATTAVAFILIGSGGTVTSAGVGMVDPTWSFPKQLVMQLFVNFEEAIRQLGLFIEHSHRLIAVVVIAMSTLLAGLCCWLEVGNRKWLGLLALAPVVIQSVLGGLRILLDPQQGVLNTSLGRDYAMIHGFFGQFTFALFVACTLFFSRSWVNREQVLTSNAAGFQGLSMLVTVLFLVQLTIAVLVRHAGGDLLIIAHAAVAGLILLLTLALLMKAGAIPSGLVRRPAWALAIEVVLMIVLGTSAWWLGAGQGALDYTEPNHHRLALATLHQWLGALTLGTSVVITLRARHHLAPVHDERGVA